MKSFLKSITLMLLTGAIVSSCKSSKIDTGSSDLDGRRVTVPCSVRSDVNFFRARGLGESIDLATSNDKALAAAQSRISQLIQAKVQKVVEEYTQSISNGTNEALGKDFQSATRNSVNQLLSNTVIACEEIIQKSNGIYTTYMGIEINKEDLKNGLNQSMLGVAQKNAIQYDKARFYEKFDKQFSQNN